MSDAPAAIDTELQAALNELMQLTGVPTPSDGITAEHVHEAVSRVRALLSQAKGGDGHTSVSTDVLSLATPRGRKHQNVLIAGQLGIIVHQLRQAITKQGGEVSIAKDVDEAIAEYQKRDYSLVIIDLYMPTEREGLIVLEEIKRISVVCHINTQVMVLAPQSKDKSLKDRCKAKGAAFFLEKIEGWHKIVLQYYQGDIPADQFEIP